MKNWWKSIFTFLVMLTLITTFGATLVASHSLYSLSNNFNLPQKKNNNQDTPVAPNKDWTGEWQTNWGKMILKQSGNTITGSYGNNGGKIQATMQDTKIVGTWMVGPTYRPPEHAGELELTVDTDGNSFTGKWRNGSTGQWHLDMQGKRQPIASPHPPEIVLVR